MNFLFFKLAFLLSIYANLTPDELITFKESLCKEFNLNILDKKNFMERNILKLNYCTEAFCDKLSKITSLKELDVYSFDDSLQVIPDSLCNLINLEHLFLEFRITSNIKKLPKKMGNLAMIKVIIMKGTKITSLPESFGSLQSLETLYMNNNKINFLPESFGLIQSLKHLQMSNNEIAYLPESFGLLQSLTNLSMDNNKIAYLPESFGSLQSLTNLSINNNKITFLPKSFGSLQSLTNLSINNNKITFLPELFGSLQYLKRLKMSNNEIAYLPESFGSLQSLTNFSMDNNKIAYLPESFGLLQSLEILKMSNNKIAYLPESFGSLQYLTDLKMNNNKITFLPESFGSLKSLTYLYMSNTEITFLPESFDSLQSLTHLYMNNNKIAYLPESFGSLQYLEILSMNNNKIFFLPISFNKLKSVSHINLSYNSLETWPDSEVEFYELKALDLSGNRIKRLPKKLIDFFKNSECFCELNIKENPEFETLDTEDSYGLFSILKILKEKAKISKDLIDKIMQKRDPSPIEIDMDVLDLFSSTIEQIPRIVAEKFKTSRNTILSDAIYRIINTESKDFRVHVLPIEFEGELGDDAGGLRNEWFGLVISKFMTLKKNLFSNYSYWDKKYGLVPAYNEGLNSQVQSPEPKIIVEEEKGILLNYRFLGIIMGMAILENCSLNLNLHLSVYQFLLGKHVTLENIKYFDTTLHNSIEYCLKEPSEYAYLFSSMVVKNCNGKCKLITINIQKDGNNDGKIENLVNLYLKYKFEYNIRKQLEALKSGFNEIIHEEECCFLSAKEFELLICGQGNIDIENLKRVATYEAIEEDNKIVVWFWEILSTYTFEELAKLIHFITGSSRVGYSGLDKFVIQYDQSVKGFIPTSSTCSNTINLYNYESCEEMKKYLEKALEYHNEKFYIK